MNKSILKKIIAVFLALTSICCSACGYLPSREEQLGVVQPQTEDPVESAHDVQENVEVKGTEPISVIISEVMPSNKATLAGPDGSFPDWVELYNTGTEPVSLEGYRLSCGGSSWSFPGVSIGAGEYLLIFCDGTSAQEDDKLHADFTIPKEGAQLSILLADGTPLEEFSFGNAVEDTSFVNDGANGINACAFPTPGFENSHEGYNAFQSSLDCDSSLVIYEVLAYNAKYMPQNRQYYDYVELKNVSNGEVELSDYFLSDKSSNRALYQLPEHSLAAGASFFVYCTEDADAMIIDGAQAPFGLSAQRETIYLSHSDGSLCDYCTLHDIPLGGSYGRIDGENGFFYFEEATPQEPNANGFRSISSTPVLSDGTDGVFNGVDSVSISLSGEGTIYYTTDGSMPTENSEPYTGPLCFSSTTVLRAVSIVPETLPGKTLDLSFIINENHTLPVVSLVMEPGDFIGGEGFYNNYGVEYEKECSVALYDGDNGFSINCGVKLHGNASKRVQDKKSLKLCFRSRYEGALDYDLFENGVTTFSSVLLRAAQEDYYSSLIRDSFTHDLAAECFPELPSQDHMYSILYVNGTYWGIYNFREAHSTAHYANHYGYDKNTVTHVKEAWGDSFGFSEDYRFITSSDLSNADNYHKAIKRLDVNSVIGWCIMEAYSGNMDCHSENMRFYYSTEDDIMRFALVDLDLGYFEGWRNFDVPFEYGYAYNTLADKLAESGEFREEFISQLSTALTGPMSNESVLALIDEYEAELTPEVARDREKWGGSLEYWQRMLKDIRSFITDGQGRAKTIANAISARFNISAETRNKYFADVK